MLRFDGLSARDDAQQFIAVALDSLVAQLADPRQGFDAVRFVARDFNDRVILEDPAPRSITALRLLFAPTA